MPKLTGEQKQNRRVIDCFTGDSSACESADKHTRSIGLWREKAWSIGGGSLMLLVVGLSMQAGARAAKEGG